MSVKKTISAGFSTATTRHGAVEFAFDGAGGPVLLSLHGGVGGADQGRLIAAWQDEGTRRILSPSRPGYLGTPLDSGRSWPEQADLLAGLLDHLELDKAAILALSASGPLAYTFAARHPDRVWALVAIDSVSGPYTTADAAAGPVAQALFMSALGQRLVHMFAGGFPRAFVNGAVRSLGHLTEEQRKRQVAHIMESPDKLAFIKALIDTTFPYAPRKAGNENDAQQLRSLSTLPFGDIRCPSLIVHGTLDADVKFFHGVRAYEAIPGAERYWIPDADHLGFWLSPDAVNAQQAVRTFLKQHEPTS